jgi:hypothetical protein
MWPRSIIHDTEKNIGPLVFFYRFRIAWFGISLPASEGPSAMDLAAHLISKEAAPAPAAFINKRRFIAEDIDLFCAIRITSVHRFIKYKT